MIGIQSIPNNTIIPVAIRPVRTSFSSGVSGYIFLKISTVNKVDAELNTDASELINAAINPPATNPFNPTGNKYLTNVGKTSSLFS